jgi:CDP-diacylglycerol---glycerol-3-phosphate 3-phosphatidyltransferase
VLMVTTREPWVATAIALCLMGLKVLSVGWLMRLGLPIPQDRRSDERTAPPVR